MRRAVSRCLWLVTTLLGLLFAANTPTLQAAAPVYQGATGYI
jgi:hypothetical protein